jgi:hypothetical protein
MIVQPIPPGVEVVGTISGPIDGIHQRREACFPRDVGFRISGLHHKEMREFRQIMIARGQLGDP